MPDRPRLHRPRLNRPELGPRSEELRREAAERSRATLRARQERFLLATRPILQSSVAAALAWIAATEILGHEQPFFAPIAAVLSLGITLGQRRRRAIEMAFGVALGIGVADLIVLGIGTGPAQIAVVVALAMSVALLLGGGPMLASQAATSAVLVATLQPPTGGIAFDRFYDACVGAGTAMIVASLFLTVDPQAAVRRRAAPVLATLRGVLEDIARALEDRDEAEAESALLRIRAIDPLLGDLAEAVDAADESSRIAPSRRRRRGELDRRLEAARQVGYAVGNAKVLARGAIRAVALHDTTPPDAIEAIRDLARAVRALEPDLDVDTHAEEAREAALRSASRANGVLQQTSNMSANHVVAQVRSIATDLMRALGEQRDSAQEAVRHAVPDPDPEDRTSDEPSPASG